MSITAVFAADKEPVFHAPPVEEMAHRQTSEPLTVGADPYVFGDKVKVAFGKVVPAQYGVLPVLVVIKNAGTKTIRLETLRVEYVGPRHARVDATSARDVRYAKGPDRPPILVGPRGPVAGRTKKNPLDAWEIEGRAFAAKMLPPGQTASGFFYFQTELENGATIYLSGLTEAESGKELLYFEIPLN
ncbi:MAG TPA: hypothetical protein VG456_13905 [Candidatus Sulfopaludibacter sp.]|jgi:hypothetical protein|nr:hypothetical protein [Candidatus Sulfopaludibacter sp.]